MSYYILFYQVLPLYTLAALVLIGVGTVSKMAFHFGIVPFLQFTRQMRMFAYYCVQVQKNKTAKGAYIPTRLTADLVEIVDLTNPEHKSSPGTRLKQIRQLAAAHILKESSK